MSNQIRISVVEWLWCMSEAKVPPQARCLAVYAVLFKITGNDELAKLSGMALKGHADKTFNHWKRHLLQNGWVVIPHQKGGRGRGIEVLPAINETPVEFTDVSRRDPSKFSANSLLERGVKIPPVSDVERDVKETPVKNTQVINTPVKETPVIFTKGGKDYQGNDTERGVEFTETPVKNTPVPADVPARGLVINNNKINYLPTTTTVEQEAASAKSLGGEFEALNGTGIDLANFISKAANVDLDIAKNMLRTNIKTYGAPALMEAYSVTMAEMAEGLIATPYKYLLSTAKRIKDGNQKRAIGVGSKTPPPAGKSNRETWLQDLEEIKASGKDKVQP